MLAQQSMPNLLGMLVPPEPNDVRGCDRVAKNFGLAAFDERVVWGANREAID